MILSGCILAPAPFAAAQNPQWSPIEIEELQAVLNVYVAPAGDPGAHHQSLYASLLAQFGEPVTFGIGTLAVTIQRVGQELAVSVAVDGVPVDSATGVDEHGRMTILVDELSHLDAAYIDLVDDVVVVGLESGEYRMLYGLRMTGGPLVSAGDDRICGCWGAVRHTLHCSDDQCNDINLPNCGTNRQGNAVPCSWQAQSGGGGGWCGRGAVMVTPVALVFAPILSRGFRRRYGSISP